MVRVRGAVAEGDAEEEAAEKDAETAELDGDELSDEESRGRARAAN